ncbi:MAG TPA: hypothetical protein VEX14_04150, partial [Burkholderiaceae bacterium]|nr:hypothetical protein [Burkholderiaceae bacterium]
MLRRQMGLACAAVCAQPMRALGEMRGLKRVLVSGPPLRRAWEEFEALADEAARFRCANVSRASTMRSTGAWSMPTMPSSLAATCGSRRSKPWRS